MSKPLAMQPGASLAGTGPSDFGREWRRRRTQQYHVFGVIATQLLMAFFRLQRVSEVGRDVLDSSPVRLTARYRFSRRACRFILFYLLM